MIVHEFRVLTPLTLEEHHTGQLFTVMKSMLDEGSDTIEVLHSEPFWAMKLIGGQYVNGHLTKKRYHFGPMTPWWIRKVVPKKSLVAIESVWDAFPYSKSVTQSANDDYTLTVETMHVVDRGITENALQLTPDVLALRHVHYVDVSGAVSKNYKKLKRASPLRIDWSQTIMCCYKLVRVEVHGWNIFKRQIESYVLNGYIESIKDFYDRMLSLTNRWSVLTVTQVRQLEEDAHRELEAQRQQRQSQPSPANRPG